MNTTLTPEQLRALRVAHEALKFDGADTADWRHRWGHLRLTLKRITDVFPEDQLYQGQS